MIRSFRVKWEIDIEAETPEEAARMARAYQLDPDGKVGVFDVSWASWATHFIPAADSPMTAHTRRVDLDADPGDTR